MKKKKLHKTLSLRRETVRKMVPEELAQVAGGGMSCGDETACDCSGSNGCTTNSIYCTLMQP